MGAVAKRPQWDPRLLWAAVALIVTILVGALIIALVDRWRKRPVQDKVSANDQLAEFRILYERGELSPEEFERIRNLLGERIRQELDLTVPPPAAPSDTGIQTREPPSTASPG